jgi:chitinase
MLALLMLGGITFSTIFGWKWWIEAQAAAAHKPWFASYVDVTATPLYPFEQLGTTQVPNVMLSFIVASSTDACTPSWGSVDNLSDASGKLDLDRRIARLEQQGGSVSVSFGGLLHNELAVSCKDPNKLLTAYQSVIDRYKLNTVDLDLENVGLTDQDAMKRRALVLAKLQSEYRAKGKSLAIWLTLPVSPQGLTPDGTNAIAQMLSDGVDITGINLMTMDYSNSRTADQTMEQASERALIESHRQLGILYQQAGINLNSASLWKKIGATPMIGQNDVANDIFTLSDAKAFNTFALSQGIGRMSLWSANRDIQCSDNYVDTKVVSDSCSGVKQDKLSFSLSLSNGFTGDLKHNALTTTEDKETTIQEPDDPTKSPYQIWQETGAYLQGTKVVWHHNVYQAKWWTQGDMPDNPVLQSWQTPWQLIGPVLPGEKPIPQPTLPKGTYPDWTGEKEFNGGDRILFNGVPYQAKWWTKGDSPAAASANADSSPWVPLTQEQVNQVMNDIKTGKPVASSSATIQNASTVTPTPLPATPTIYYSRPFIDR